MKPMLSSAWAAVLLTSAMSGAVAAEPRPAIIWKLDQAATHDGLDSPVGMAYDTGGALYVANWSSGSVLRFSPKGERTVFASGLSGPSGLAISARGDVYVASYNEDFWLMNMDMNSTLPRIPARMPTIIETSAAPSRRSCARSSITSAPTGPDATLRARTDHVGRISAQRVIGQAPPTAHRWPITASRLIRPTKIEIPPCLTPAAGRPAACRA